MSPNHLRPGRALALALAALLPLAALAVDPKLAGTTGVTHQAKGVGCADCHGKGKPAAVPAEKCLSCHGTYDELVKKTAHLRPVNPHASPHWGADIECRVCHRQHEPTVNWCAHCHTTDEKVP
jgi:RecJ-like exonuclease